MSMRPLMSTPHARYFFTLYPTIARPSSNFDGSLAHRTSTSNSGDADRATSRRGGQAESWLVQSLVRRRIHSSNRRSENPYPPVLNRTIGRPFLFL